MASNNLRRRRSRRPADPCASIGSLPIPDPRTWPGDAQRWFRNTVGEAGPLDVFLFDYGYAGCLYMHDAITAAAILSIDISEWHIESGYPAFIFDVTRICEIQQSLGLYGYDVHVLEPSSQPQAEKTVKQATVMSIGEVRDRAMRRERAQKEHS